MNKVNQSYSDKPPVKCFRCLEIGHIARGCKKDFERKSVREDQQLAETNETYFSSYNSAERVDGDLVKDSGSTCRLIRIGIQLLNWTRALAKLLKTLKKQQR